MSQDTARVDAEQQLDLVDPARVQRGEVKDEPVIVSGVELIPHGLRAMGIEVVPDDVNATLGVVKCHLLHEGDKVDLRAPVSATPKDAPGVHVHGGDEGLCAVADVLELATSRTSEPVRIFVCGHSMTKRSMNATQDKHRCGGQGGDAANSG